MCVHSSVVGDVVDGTQTEVLSKWRPEQFINFKHFCYATTNNPFYLRNSFVEPFIGDALLLLYYSPVHVQALQLHLLNVVFMAIAGRHPIYPATGE